MKQQLKGIALIVFSILIVVIGIAMTPELSVYFGNVMAIVGGAIGICGIVMALSNGSN